MKKKKILIITEKQVKRLINQLINESLFVHDLQSKEQQLFHWGRDWTSAFHEIGLGREGASDWRE